MGFLWTISSYSKARHRYVWSKACIHEMGAWEKIGMAWNIIAPARLKFNKYQCIEGGGCKCHAGHTHCSICTRSKLRRQIALPSLPKHQKKPRESSRSTQNTWAPSGAPTCLRSITSAVVGARCTFWRKIARYNITFLNIIYIYYLCVYIINNCWWVLKTSL